MKRVPPLLLVLGIALLTTGLTFMALTMPTGVETAQAGPLPAGHPPLDVQATNTLSTTIHDFFLPGTQPNQITATIESASTCRTCHEGYAANPDLDMPAEYEPFTGWAGSMMAQAGRDPLFYAALDIANADAAEAGEFCLRCHLPKGWLEGRSTPSDGSAMTAADLEGVQCAVCHRLVDPDPDPDNPARDAAVLAALAPTQTLAITEVENAKLIVDTAAYFRGPFDVIADFGDDPHQLFPIAEATLTSPFHQESALCGNCHDISNPLLSWDDAQQEYVLNDLDTPASDADDLFPIERTYTEWLLSDYNTPQGVYAPQFGGNKTHVATCQDCHMRDVTGKGAAFFGDHEQVVERDDLPLHDLTGANTWVPQIIPLHPVFSATVNNDPARAQALVSGTLRARTMLQNAATLEAIKIGNQLIVTVTNESGHKLPTGYIEGRRMWLQVAAYDEAGNLVYSSGAYDAATGDLTRDPDLKIYESIHVVTGTVAATANVTSGAEFHFALNNLILSDNRIPPRGYTYAAFAAAGAAPYANGRPDPTRYSDGQYWDTTTYTLPETAAFGAVRLLHQVASKEYIEFLRDNNPNAGDPNNNGQILYDLWLASGRSAPEQMALFPFGGYTYLPFITKGPAP